MSPFQSPAGSSIAATAATTCPATFRAPLSTAASVCSASFLTFSRVRLSMAFHRAAYSSWRRDSRAKRAFLMARPAAFLMCEGVEGSWRARERDSKYCAVSFVW